MIALCAVCSLMQSCTNELPEVPTSRDFRAQNVTLSNSLENDITNIAIKGYQRFYGNHNDCSRGAESASQLYPLNIVPIRKLSSRNSEEKSLLYVVNFANNKGFAVVSTAQLGENLLAVSDSGSYDANLINEIPGLSLWMNNAIAYAEAKETLSQDSLYKPLFPKDPIDGRIQNKEWNDTTSHVYISPQLPIAWGQGNGNITDINSPNCEGLYFSNGICGCGTLAIAQICAGLEYPNSLNEIYPGVGTLHAFDWDAITRHKAKQINIFTGKELESGKCSESNQAKTHESIARLCQIIGNYGHAKPNGKETGMTETNILGAAKLIFGYDNVSHPWMKLSIGAHFPKGVMAIIIGESKYDGESAHAWVCDGCEHIYYTHYFATRKDDIHPWQIQSSADSESHYLHFNWGWNAAGNGWFYSIEPDVKQYSQVGYTNLQYITIRH